MTQNIGTLTAEQKKKLKELKNREEIQAYIASEKIQLTEEQMNAVAGGTGPEIELPEIFD